jgi:elongation factor Ts
VVLLEQVWVHDGETRVREVARKSGVTLTGFARFLLGEGIEKQTGDFAAEVAAAAGLTPKD